MPTITVREGQTLADIAVQYLGDAARINEIADLNGILMTDELSIGQQLYIPEDVAIDKRYVKDTFIDYALIPASKSTGSVIEVNEDEGIGFWAIEDDFVVQ